MKPGKVLCYRFLFPILGVDRAQNLTKYNILHRVMRIRLKNYWTIDVTRQRLCTKLSRKHENGRQISTLRRKNGSGEKHKKTSGSGGIGDS